MSTAGGTRLHEAITAQVRIITRFEDAQAIAPAWERLYRETPGATPWQSWPWFVAWWSSMGTTASLCVVLVETAAGIQLLLPLQCRSTRMLAMPIRVLEPIGMPEEINRPQFALGAADRTALRMALREIMNGPASPRWDLLRLDEVQMDGWWVRELLETAADHQLRCHQVEQHPCPYLDLRQDWDTFLASRGRKLSRNLRAAERKLAETGPISLEFARTREDIDTAFDRFLGLYRQSWKQEAGVGFARQDGYARYYRRFLALMAESGQARILTLLSGRTPVAAAVAVTDNASYYGAQIVQDQRFDRCSPGTLLEAIELRGLMEEGAFHDYDFFGAALNNKRRWTDTARHTHRLLLFRPNAVATMLERYYFALKPVLRRLRPVRHRH